jgi:hypothetical protein
MILLDPHKIMSKIKRMNKMKIKLKIKRKALIKGDEDDGDHEGSRTTSTHPRVRQTVQRDHPMHNILGDIKKWVTTRSRIATFVNITRLFFLWNLLRWKMHYVICIGW